MSGITVSPLREGLPFGVRVVGVTQEATKDRGIRQEINDLFHRHCVIIFEGVEPSDAMQLALSDVFGPLKEHPVKNVTRVDGDGMPGVVRIHSPGGSGGLVELNGKQLSHWLPWQLLVPPHLRNPA